MSVYCIVNAQQKLHDRTRKIFLNEPMMYDNARAHCFRLYLTDDDGNTPADLSGASVTAAFLRPDNVTVYITDGTITGNMVEVILSDDCYSAAGRYKLTVNLTESGNETVRTALIVEGITERNISSTTVIPDSVISDIDDLIEEIETAVASVPSDYSSLLTTIAPNFSGTTDYVAGEYVWYDGTLYRFTTAHSAGSWSGADVETAVIMSNYAEDIAGLTYNTDMLAEQMENLTGNTVHLDSQTLTDAQKAQARANIGAADAETASSVRYDTSQTLNFMQKTQARSNIGAVSESVLTLPLSWAQGTINGTTGQDGNSSNLTRIRSVNSIGSSKYVPITGNGYVRAEIGSGFKWSVRVYTSSGSFVGGSANWLANGAEYPVEAGQQIRFVAARIDDSNIAPSAASGFVFKQLLGVPATVDRVTEMSDNLFDASKLQRYGFSTATLITSDACRAFIWPVIAGNTYTFSRASTASPDRIRVGFLKTSPADGVSVYSLRGYAETINSEDKGDFDGLTSKTFTVPSDCIWGVMYISNSNNEPDSGTQLTLVEGSTTGTWGQVPGSTAIDTIARDGVNDIVQRNDPDAMLSKLQQLNRPTRTGNRTLGTPPLCLIHFSDVHGDEYCLRNIETFRNHYSGYITDVLHTGDSVTTYAGNGMAFWNNVTGAASYLNAIGNHDTRKNSGNWSSTQTAAESLAAYITPYVSNWGVTIGSGVCYYYKDYAANKIRLIVLDVMHDDATQRSWFATTLAGAKTAGYHVIVAAHCMATTSLTPLTTPWDDKPVVPWYEEGFPDLSSDNYPQWLDGSYTAAVADFQNGGGNFVCWLHGHVHCAMFAKVTGKNQINIGVGNAGGQEFAWTYAQARHQGTRSADDFNVIAVDVDSSILRIVKVGVDYNRAMMHKDVICYDYANGVILSQ